MSRRSRDGGRVGGAASTRPGRGVSTVLDVALFLLLVGAAVAVLYAVPDGPGADEARDADASSAVATTLATTTTEVEYAPAGASANATWTDRGSVLALLARATVEDAVFDASEAAASDATANLGYPDAVADAVRRELRAIEGDRRVQVRAVWEPLPGAGLRGETTVGPEPPARADVHAATTTVPIGTARRSGVAATDWGAPAGESALGRLASPLRDATSDDAYSDWPFEGGTTPFPVDRREVDGAGIDAIADAGDGLDGGAAGDAVAGDDAIEDCRAVALVVARRTVGHLFPPERTRAALRSEQGAMAGDDAATREDVAARYEAVAALAGVDESEVPRGDDVRGTNARLVAGLAGTFAPTACDGYEDAAAAADAAAPDEVTVVVRTWSP